MLKRIDGGTDYLFFSDGTSDEEKQKAIVAFNEHVSNEYYEDGQESVDK